MVDLAFRADQAYGHRVADVAARRAEPQLQIARLDDAPTPPARERRQIRVDREGHRCRVAGFERYAGVPDEAVAGPGHLRDRIVQVELDHLGPGALARVADGDRDLGL